MNGTIMALSEEDIKIMLSIDGRVSSANRTCEFALKHHTDTIYNLAQERDDFWALLRMRFKLPESCDFRISNENGFYQVISSGSSVLDATEGNA